MNILDFFDLILSQQKENTIFREVLWAVSNICAGTIEQCMKVMESPIFEKVLEYLSDPDYKIKREALLVINYYSSSNSLDMSLKLVNKGILQKICWILENDMNENILNLCLVVIFEFLSTGEHLKGLEPENRFAKIFDKCGGVSLVENLQMHNNLDIHKISLVILERFYETNEITN